ncbi:hypothetical protein DDI_3012 [Dickeya dianthicola RNS04.9]|nr:hypothetical protein DDI_3012 [Dickeya dianthicola RNS04.9]
MSERRQHTCNLKYDGYKSYIHSHPQAANSACFIFHSFSQKNAGIKIT